MSATNRLSQRPGWAALGLLLSSLAHADTAVTAGPSAHPSAHPPTLAPLFSLPGPQGRVTLSALRGSVVYVDFWASWCGPCRDSFPWMNDLIDRHGERGLQIVAINLDEDASAAERFLAELAPRFDIAFDPAARSAEAYGVLGMPSSWLIGPDGRVLFAHVGFRSADRAVIEAQIDDALSRLSHGFAELEDSP